MAVQYKNTRFKYNTASCLAAIIHFYLKDLSLFTCVKYFTQVLLKTVVLVSLLRLLSPRSGPK